MFRLRVIWERQGEVRWESDWTGRYGHTRSHVPGLDEHLGFANYDLKRNGLPEIQKSPEGDLLIEFDPIAVSGLPANAGWAIIHGAAVERMTAVFGPHGFKATELID